MSRVTVALAQINNRFSGSSYLPYAAGLLQSVVEASPETAGRFEWLLPLYRRLPVADAVSRLKGARIVGFSLYVWNVRLSLAIAERLKREDPDVLIIAGGPQVPDRPDAFLEAHPFIDVVVHGEGERTFRDLLARWPARDWHGIAGISWRDPSGYTVAARPRLRLRDLSGIPSPYLNGAFDALMAANPDEEWLALWETNRGCPFQCSFCDWGSATSGKVAQFEMARLTAELEWFADKRIEFVFCCDANFGMLPRDLDLARHAAAVRALSGYPRALSVQNTKNATGRAYMAQKILADAGLNKGVTLSMQTLHAPALDAIKRRNISLASYEELQRRFTRDGIATYSDLILGLPGETCDSFANGIDALIENGQHNRIQFNNLSVLPNAEMGDPDYQRRHAMELVETRILNMHGAWAAADEHGLAETQALVVATSTMPRADWRRARALAWMTALLHFDKLLQIPFIVLHEMTGTGYREMIEAFLAVEAAEHPTLAMIRDHFLARAAAIQNGGPEYHYSAEWLGIWWPDDEYMLIRLASEGLLDAFYREAGSLLLAKAAERGPAVDLSVVADALRLNRALLKLPGQPDDLELRLASNLLEVYEAALAGRSVPLRRQPTAYRIERSAAVWDDWPAWCREVVWWGNKKGAYLYGSRALEKYYAGHH